MAHTATRRTARKRTTYRKRWNAFKRDAKMAATFMILGWMSAHGLGTAILEALSI